MASKWRTVPPRFRCQAGVIDKPIDIPSSGALELTIDTDACGGLPHHVRYLEHVQVGRYTFANANYFEITNCFNVTLFVGFYHIGSIKKR